MTLEEVLRLPLGEILAKIEKTEAPPTAAPVEERLLSVEEAAKRMGVTTDMLYRMKNLPFTVKLGRLRRYSETGLNKWIRQRAGRA